MVDHNMIFGIRKLNARAFRKRKGRIIETCSLNKYDKKSFPNDISMVDWKTILDPVMASSFLGILEFS